MGSTSEASHKRHEFHLQWPFYVYSQRRHRAGPHLAGILREGFRSFRYLDSRQFSVGPDMHGLGYVHGRIQRIGPNLEHFVGVLVAVPDARAACSAQEGVLNVAAVGGSRPFFWCAQSQAHIGAWHDHGQTIGRGRLLLAACAMAHH